MLTHSCPFLSCFTDGVGLTSQAVMDRCARVLEGEDTAGEFSAVQVRIGGAKGMLVAWPHIGRKKKVIILRKSMVKFDSPSQDLGAIKVSPSRSPDNITQRAHGPSVCVFRWRAGRLRI